MSCVGTRNDAWPERAGPDALGVHMMLLRRRFSALPGAGARCSWRQQEESSNKRSAMLGTPSCSHAGTEQWRPQHRPRSPATHRFRLQQPQEACRWLAGRFSNKRLVLQDT
jgi:hypothetical protein